ncbi:MAG: trans-sulfuration enzyme family protein, partial [Thermodesulfovibrionales bacterium]
GTYEFIAKDLIRLGIEHDFIDHDDPAQWSRKLRASTKVIFVETMTNPLLQIADLKAVAEFAREHSLISMIDNTFASPVNFRPVEWGFDLSIHSCTKYLNGHSDVLAGAVIGGGNHIRMISSTLTRLGGSLDPHACYLLYRGMKTLALRVRAQNRSALLIAQHLKGHPNVEKVNYPGLDTHPDHARAMRFLDGFGGMVSFQPRGGPKAAERFMGATTIPIVAPSLGGIETLMVRPAVASHTTMPQEVRERLGITDSLIRISVGIEDPGDLIKDFQEALAF